MSEGPYKLIVDGLEVTINGQAAQTDSNERSAHNEPS